MTRPQFIPALMIFPLLLLLTGCHKDTVAGKWQGTSPGPQGSVLAMTYSFTPDGKETIDVHTQGASASRVVGLHGTYKVDSTNLTQTTPVMTVRSRTINLPPSESKPYTAPFTLDGDTLTLNNPVSKQPMTLTRVKE